MKLVDLIGVARAGIAAVWDSMRAGPAQRRAMFPPFHAASHEFSPELYEAHEAYLPTVSFRIDQIRLKR